MNKSFNLDGPVEISTACFDDYEKMQPHFDALFNGWINENNSDELRRLFIRDITRQAEGISVGAYCHQLSQSFDRILHSSGEGQSGSLLMYHLENRPKLLDEFVTEFLYTLQHYPSSPNANSHLARCKVIELLLHLVDEPTSRQLLKYHSLLGRPIPYENTDRFARKARYLLDCWRNPDLPAWLHAEIEQNLERFLSIEVENRRGLFVEKPITAIQDSDVYCLPIIKAIVWDIDHSIHHPNLIPSQAEPLIRLLEKHLPSGTLYHHCQMRSFTKIAPKLHDTILALNYSLRHLPLITNYLHDLSQEDLQLYRNFLYWLIGASHAYTIDPDVIIQFKNILDQIEVHAND